jgi:protein disulfide-isomerase
MVAQIAGGPPAEPTGPSNRPVEASGGDFCRANMPLSDQGQMSAVNPPYASQTNIPGLTPGSQAPDGPPPPAAPQYAMGSRGIAGQQGENQASPPATAPGTMHRGSPASVDLPPGVPPLALDGFCPVQLTENDRWTMGNRRWGAIHEGRTYLFAGPDEQNRFLADPTRYAPVLSGDDVVKLVDEGRRLAGGRAYGCWFQGKLYLFASLETYEQFARNPFRYSSRLEAASSPSNRPPLR